MARRTKNNEPDWLPVYLDWLTGKYSIAELGRRHGLAGTSVRQKIGRDKWTAENGPAPKRPVIPDTPTPTPAERRAVKQQNAQQLRKRALNLAQRLLAEVEDATTYEGEISDLIALEETDPMRRRAALRALSSGERIKNLKELTYVIDAADGKKTAKLKAENADEPKGKKAERQASAEKAAASGVFAVPSPPRLVVNG